MKSVKSASFLSIVFTFILIAVLAGNAYAVRDEQRSLRIDKRDGQTVGTQESKLKYKEGDLLVKYKKSSSSEKLKSAHGKIGAEKIREFTSIRLHHVKLKKGMTTEEGIAFYSTIPDVEYAEPNYIVKAMSLTPNDYDPATLWGLAKIHAPEAWDSTIGSNDVVVAVIDTGVDYNHADLAGNIWVNNGETAGNSIDDDADGYVDDIHGVNTLTNSGNPMDDAGHGTHVAGTIGASGNNGLGVTGVNWQVGIMACKFLGSDGYGTDAGAIACLEYIKMMKQRGINIIATNNSYGGGDYSQALYDAINDQQDILFIAAAGNDGSDNDKTAAYPASYALPNIIAVAATDPDDVLPSWSNHGRRSVSVAAPGTDIYSTVPNGGYGTKSGTSMATPHVTGLAALLKAQDPGRDWKTVKNLILSGGDSVDALKDETITGRRINAFNSLNCIDRTVFSVLQVPSSLTPGTSYTLSVLSINCGIPAGPLTVTTSGGEPVTMSDADGAGIFTGTWIPSHESEYMVISSPAGQQILEYPPLQIISTVLPEGTLSYQYTNSVSATGGIPPYNWALISGNLPPGLSINSSGAIAGVPSTIGNFSFTVEVIDSIGVQLRKTVFITVSNDIAVQSWLRPDVMSPGYGSYDGDIAVDDAGSVYVTGNNYYWQNRHYNVRIKKYDSSGNVIWSRTDVRGSGSGIYDALNSIKADKTGNVYGAGYSSNGTGTVVSCLLVKYDSSSGTVLWSRTYSDFSFCNLNSVAVDESGYVYAAGYDHGHYSPNSSGGLVALTFKYDSSGNLIWKKSEGVAADFYITVARGLAVDKAGKVTVTGYSDSYILTWQYDASGNRLWSIPYYVDPAHYYYHGDAIAIDEQGNVYVTGLKHGRSGNDADTYYQTLKYDTSGNLLWSQTYQGYLILPRGIAVDKNGNIYVTGDRWTNNDFYGPRGVTTISYDASGNLRWIKDYSNPEYLKSWSTGVAVDKDGQVYIVGFSYNNEDNFDFYTLKYAQFLPLTYSRLGTGGGTVNFSNGDSCAANCTQRIAYTTPVTLTAVPDANAAIFAGWSGACTGMGECTVVMNSDTTVTATFNVATFFTITGSTGITSGGSISPSGAVSVVSGSTQTFTITPYTGYHISSVQVDGSNVGALYSYSFTNVTANHSIVAYFAADPILTVAKAGTGSGTVTSSPSGINCGSSCTARFNGTTVLLNADPITGSTFSGWSGGGCSGTGVCTVVMNTDTAVTATFAACSNVPVKITRTPDIIYNAFQTAYDNASDGDIIQSVAMNITGGLDLNRDIPITLKGGYDCAYASNPASTTINGALIISNGTVTIENIVLE